MVFFLIIAGISTFTLVRDLSTTGFKPFGFIEQIIAQTTRENFVPNKFNLATDTTKLVFDQPQRCRAFNPRTGKQFKGILGGAGLNDGKGGINQGTLGTPSKEMDFAQGKNSTGEDLNMGYVVSIFMSPGDAGNAINYINEANERGFTPVVRMCFAGGGCQFRIPGDDIINFYSTIAAGIEPGNEFVAILGPNEPGTANESGQLEMSAFGVEGKNYGLLVAEANRTAEALQSIRVEFGGGAYLAPAAFNITNRENDDVKEYTSGSLRPDLFDYLIGNTYDLNPAGTYIGAYEWYEQSGMKQYVEDNGLRVILTEFGKFGTPIEKLKESFQKFCDDPSVDGISFFRSFEELQSSTPRPDQLSTRDVLEMTASCSKIRTWVDCNFDTLAYSENPKKIPLTTPDNAAAKAQYKEGDPELIDTKGAALKVDCRMECDPIEGCFKGTCDAKSMSTIKVRAPIKQFGNNSGLGIKSKSFTPICASVASYLGNEKYDALNQYASPIFMSSQLATSATPPNYNDGRPRGAKVSIFGDSQSAPTPSRGIFMPDQWYGQVVRLAAIPGASSKSFADHEAQYYDRYNAAIESGADAAVVMLGTNDCPAFSADEFASNVSQIVSEIRAGGTEKVFVVKVPYRSDGQCSDDKIDEYNSKLANVGATFVNVPYNKSDKNSFLDSDGIHIDAYGPVNEYIYAAITGGEPKNTTFPSLSPSELGPYYPMPWLGSAMNCATELVKYANDFSGNAFNIANPNPGSYITNTQNDIKADFERSLEKLNNTTECMQVDQGSNSYISDERTVIVNGSNFDKCNIDLSKAVRDYYPFRTPNKFDFPPKEAESEMRYLVNQDEYIWGPELKQAEETITVGTPSRMCYMYLHGILKVGDKEIDYGQNPLDCRVRNISVGGDSCYSWNFRQDITDEAIDNCFTYFPVEKDTIRIFTKAYSNIPELNIPNIYDSLYTTYQRLTQFLKERNLKLKVNNNVGWKIEGWSIIRDASIESRNPSASWYIAKDVEKTYIDIESPPNTGTATQPDLFNNEIVMAGGKSTSKANFFYDWLGYLDIFQEYISAYVDNQTVPAEEEIANPFFNKGGEPVSDREKILVAGIANKLISFPILTCDQYEIGKRYTYQELLTLGYSQDVAEKLWPYDFKLAPESTPTCITQSYDTRFENKLEQELCRRGYVVPNVCEIKCIPPASTTPTGNLAGTTCPVAGGHRCFQGATGSFTHCAEATLPLDLYPHFVNGSADPGRRDLRVVSPESGTVQTIADNGAQGSFIEILGESGILYKMQHMARSKFQVQVGDEVSVGQIIGEIATMQSYPGLAYTNDSIHLHVTGRKDGQDIDPYYLFGEVLGCNARRPVDSGGNPIPENTAVGMDNGFCVSSGGGRGLLQDNSPLCSKPQGLTGDAVFNGVAPEDISNPPSALNSLSCEVDSPGVPGDRGDSSGGGVVGCDIPIASPSADPIDFNSIKPYLDVYGRAYNEDSNSSYTFINDQEMFNFVTGKAKSLGINPKFAITLWLEETGGSAVGSWGMGCIYFRDGRQTGRLDGLDRRDRGAMQGHISEQLDCLKTYVDQFPDFLGFMCTYSGEVGRPNCTSFENNPNFPKNICRINEEIGSYF